MQATEILPPVKSYTPLYRPIYQRISQRIFETFARVVCLVWCPLRIAGRENLPSGPFLICANHSSHMDCIVLMIATGQPFRRFATLAASDYFFNNKLRRLGFNCLLNLVPLDRSAPPSSMGRTLSRCSEFLNQGNGGLIMFPEGTRSTTGEVGPFKRAAALFSTRLEIPVVPVWIGGTGRVMPNGRFFPRRGPITVRIGEPLWPREDDSLMRKAHDQIVAMQESFRE